MHINPKKTLCLFIKHICTAISLYNYVFAIKTLWPAPEADCNLLKQCFKSSVFPHDRLSLSREIWDRENHSLPSACCCRSKSRFICHGLLNTSSKACWEKPQNGCLMFSAVLLCNNGLSLRFNYG